MNKKIILADKDKSNRSYIKQIIDSYESFEVIEVDEARELLHVSVNATPSLMIIDINISSQNYEKIIEIIRSSRPKEVLPIVVISYAIDKEKIISLLRLGIEDFILKPFNQNILLEKLKYLLEKLNGSANLISQKAVEAADNSDKERYLLIDHDRNFRNQFIKLFGEKYEIISAENGEEGFAFFEKYHPQYVFIAEHLKVINERILIKKIRDIATPETKIYFLSTILKSSAMKSSLFNGVVEKSVSPAIFHKEFAKVVWGEETNLFQKATKLIRNTILGYLGGMIKKSFNEMLKDEYTIYTPNESFKNPNEGFASVELIDDKKEMSVTLGLYGESKDILFIAERIIGEQVPFNAKAIEAIGGVISALGEQVKQFLSTNGIELELQNAKVTSKLENKLSFDWDLEVFIKDSKNSHYVIGLYCSKYI
jgi:two-component system chemotaxis response regulator CheY